MSDDEIWNNLIDLWSEVTMIAGAIMYPEFLEDEQRNKIENPLFDHQLRMLTRFVTTHPKYCQLTRNEIVHAFYLNAQGEFADSAPAGTGGMFRHYNKELNAEFVGDVLNAYVRKKLRMWDLNQHAIWKALDPPPEVKLILTADDWKRFIQDDYDLYRAGTPHLIIHCEPRYCFLRKCGLIRFKDKANWMKWYIDALNMREHRARINAAKEKIVRGQETNGALLVYHEIRLTGKVPFYEHINVINEMRRMCYLRFFELISGCAINKIFEEIEFKNPSNHDH